MASELWAYKKAPVQTQAIVISSDDDEDPIYTLPDTKGNKKRRRLPRRTTAVKPISLDSEEEVTRDSQQSDQPAAAAPQQPASPEPAPQQPQRRRSAVQLDPGVRDLLEANKRLMAELQRAAQDTLDDDDFEDTEEQQPEPAAAAAAAEADGQRVVLVCRTQHHGDLKLRLRCSDPLSKLFAVFRAKAEEKGWVAPGGQLHFEFDGDQLTGNETPSALEMEDEDAIEVKMGDHSS